MILCSLVNGAQKSLCSAQNFKHPDIEKTLHK
jgi:hypothetical protein